jgi:hypothetical protein
MRVNVVRALPTSHRHTRTLDRDRRLSPLAARHPGRARAGLQLGGACLAFLVAYVTITLLHALRINPTFVVALAPIPLFARFLASAAVAVPAGLLLGVLVRDRAAWLRRLPLLLAATLALFVVTIALFA